MRLTVAFERDQARPSERRQEQRWVHAAEAIEAWVF